MKMKKAIIVIYCLLGLISVCQAQDHLRIHYKNGTQADVPLAQIDSITFVEGSSVPAEPKLESSWLWGSQEQSYYELLTMRTSPMRLLGLLSGEFQVMLMVKTMRGKGFDAAQIAQRAKIHPYRVKKSEQLSGRFSIPELKQALADCLEAEEAIKSGLMSDKLSLESLIIKYAG